MSNHSSELLLSAQLTPKRVEALLRPYGFADWTKADATLQRIADEPRARHLLAGILTPLLEELAQSPNPDQALVFLERLTRAALSRTNLLAYLNDSRSTLALVCRLLGSSPFMAEILIRNPTYLYWLADERVLKRQPTRRDMTHQLAKAWSMLRTDARKLDRLRVIKRKLLLWIGARDLLRLATVEQTTAALSDLADVLLAKALAVSTAALRRRYGRPAAGRRGARFVVLGLGKLGGAELNFSSDVDLIYLYDGGADATSGRRGARASRISTAEYFQRLGRAFTAAVTTVTNEGALYRVDLRLRPEGGAGPIAWAEPIARRYYTRKGRTWERLALQKARPSAGYRALGAAFLRSVAPFIYGNPFTPVEFGEVEAIKRRIDKNLRARGEARRNVKLGTGGIREVEFIVQALQAQAGGRKRQLRERNTLRALARLRRAGLLTPAAYETLRAAYRFLRDVEHKLQMVAALQTHTLPTDRNELRRCALRMGYRDAPAASAADQFSADHRRHTEGVNRLFRALFAHRLG